MSYSYPIDIPDLVSRLQRRGEAVTRFVGLESGMRDDVKLTHIVWGVAHGWFPVHHDGSWHGAVDIGLPDWNGETYRGAPVCAVSAGTVVYVGPELVSTNGEDFGRMIIQHATPGGQTFYAHYKHVVGMNAFPGKQVSGGERIGRVGSYRSFPHLSFAIASAEPIGGSTDLVPECARSALPEGDGVYNVLRVKLDALDPFEWPVDALKNRPAYLFNPIELVRHCRGEPYVHDVGAGYWHGLAPCHRAEARSVPLDSHTDVNGSPLHSKAMKDDPDLLALARDPNGAPIQRGHSKKATVVALQTALTACQYRIGRFGPKHDGVDGDFGATTEGVVQRFQQEKLKPMFQSDAGKKVLAAFGQTAASVRTDGVVDWLTLLGLDLAAVALESAPPPPAPPVVQPASPAPASAPSGDEISLEEARVILLKCTAVFEGAWDTAKNDFAYGAVAPNFDLAGMSIGIIQWNLLNKNVFPLLKKVLAAVPDKFQACYEAGSPQRFQPYFSSGWPSSYVKDVWTYAGFLALMNTSSLPQHLDWVKQLHKPEAIHPASPSDASKPKWRTKDGYGTAKKALRPELVDFFARLGQVKEFQDASREDAWKKYGVDRALGTLQWLRQATQAKFPDLLKRVELRTIAALFDFSVQQGSMKPSTKTRIKDKIAANNYATQAAFMEMAVVEMAKGAGEEWQNACASRRLGFLKAQATPSSNLSGKAYTVQNCNYALLKNNPHVKDL